MVLSDVVIILCRASEPGNVGAVCRVMKNMGISQLRMVAPAPLDEATLLTRVVHAEDVWRTARFFDTLADAAADCSLVVGTTRRRGKRRKGVTLEPRALMSWLAPRLEKCAAAPLAFVFGNERTGLTDDELNFCNIASHIPVSEAFPSLNLSHAVQIYAYELFLAFGGVEENPVKGEWVPLERQAVDTLTADITGTLAELGFYRHPGREEQTRFLRDLICRAGLTEREGRYLRNIFAKAAKLGSRQDN
ncbi:MAG: TrmJ/YjtD family RNA methyltransferase [Treponema sp.]|jgi:tRNA/rRNA methyltransferase/tRNA (cytidine32/uridine32-2'-O)-methyltransferase|nr:TrmJ/YjtD family RNA methyltransferase [Treponema sp.]